MSKEKTVFNQCHSDMLNNMSNGLWLLETKGSDYGIDNFKEAAKIASILTGQDIRPMDVAACLVGIKCARYGNIISSGHKPNHESVQDTIQDLANYVHLMERERMREILESNESIE